MENTSNASAEKASGSTGSDWAGTVPQPAMTPDVTVVVPCYNVEKYLAQCLSSILENTRAVLEVIAVNDGSPDGSLAVMKSFAARDPRVHVIDKPNGGYGMAVNAGLANAHGTYVAVVEPDDYVRPHFYDHTVAFARSFETLPDVVKTPYLRITMPDTPKERTYYCAYYDRLRPPHQPFTIAEVPRLLQHHPSIWSALYRRAFLEEKGIRFMEVPGAGWVDNPFLVETLCQASSIVYLNTPYYCYREDLPGSSSMLRSTLLGFERWHQMLDIIERLGIDDPRVLAAHYVRGFTYMGGALEAADAQSSDEVSRAMASMVARMDPKLVLVSRYLDGNRKRMFCRLRGIEGASWSELPHLGSLADELVYSLRTNGIGFAASRIGMYFARKLHIKANDPTKTASAGI